MKVGGKNFLFGYANSKVAAFARQPLDPGEETKWFYKQGCDSATPGVLLPKVCIEKPEKPRKEEDTVLLGCAQTCILKEALQLSICEPTLITVRILP